VRRWALTLVAGAAVILGTGVAAATTVTTNVPSSGVVAGVPNVVSPTETRTSATPTGLAPVSQTVQTVTQRVQPPAPAPTVTSATVATRYPTSRSGVAQTVVNSTSRHASAGVGTPVQQQQVPVVANAASRVNSTSRHASAGVGTPVQQQQVPVVANAASRAISTSRHVSAGVGTPVRQQQVPVVAKAAGRAISTLPTRSQAVPTTARTGTATVSTAVARVRGGVAQITSRATVQTVTSSVPAAAAPAAAVTTKVEATTTAVQPKAVVTSNVTYVQASANHAVEQAHHGATQVSRSIARQGSTGETTRSDARFAKAAFSGTAARIPRRTATAGVGRTVHKSDRHATGRRGHGSRVHRHPSKRSVRSTTERRCRDAGLAGDHPGAGIPVASERRPEPPAGSTQTPSITSAGPTPSRSGADDALLAGFVAVLVLGGGALAGATRGTVPVGELVSTAHLNFGTVKLIPCRVTLAVARAIDAVQAPHPRLAELRELAVQHLPKPHVRTVLPAHLKPPAHAGFGPFGPYDAAGRTNGGAYLRRLVTLVLALLSALAAFVAWSRRELAWGKGKGEG
jgi:hypothetical protein